MISSIIDADGFLVFTGNDVDTKFSTVLARSGHSRVDIEYPYLKKPKWDGTKWIEGETDLEVWQMKMSEADGLFMPRDLEDLITDNPTLTINEYTQVKYDAKIKLRATKP